MTLVVGPGTKVLNQSLKDPLGGTVVARAEGGDLIVRWSDGDLTEEFPGDLTLTGALVLIEEGT